MYALLAELLAAFDRRLPVIHCLIVETRGSTPQKAGAAMLIYADGRQSGTLGGGCVEAEVKRRALHALAGDGSPEVFRFCLDDDYGWDDGLICGGRMTVLAHPLTESGVALDEAARYFMQMQGLTDRGRGFTEVVAIEAISGRAVGDRYLFDADGNPAADLAGRPAWQAVAANLAPLSLRPCPSIKDGVAYLPLRPRITLLLIGGGHVAQAVARLAAEVDFDIWVLDDRERFAAPQRFPAASRCLVGDIGNTLRDLAPSLSASTFAVILTRGHNHDEEALYHLAESACGYVGMIGSRRKIRLIFDDLLAKGIAPEALARVHAPLGYNIGSETVAEIAVSILAELIACRNAGTTELARQSWARPPRADRQQKLGCIAGSAPHCGGGGRR